MQPVYNDGRLGNIQNFDKEIMEELLKNDLIDHVKVFDLEKGMKINDEEIFEKNKKEEIRKMIKEEISDEKRKENQKRELEFLKKQFETKVAQHGI